MAGEYKKYYIVDNFVNANKGFKDLTRDGWYNIQFFPLNKIGANATSDVGKNMNFIGDETTGANDDMIFTLYTRQVSGLPTFKVKSVTDTHFGGWINKMPGNVENPAGTLTVEFIVKTSGFPLTGIFTFFNKVYNNHTDMYAASIDNDFKYIADAKNDAYIKDLDDGFDKTAYENYIKALEDRFKAMTNNFASDIFFNTSVSMLDFQTKNPHFTYMLHNCWISSVKLYDSVKPGNDNIINGSMTIEYDFGRLMNLAGMENQAPLKTNNDKK